MTDSTMRMAPPGTIWMCKACAKTSDDLYGIEGWHSHGWDESCMLNAVLIDQDRRTPIVTPRADGESASQKSET